MFFQFEQLENVNSPISSRYELFSNSIELSKKQLSPIFLTLDEIIIRFNFLQLENAKLPIMKSYSINL